MWSDAVMTARRVRHEQTPAGVGPIARTSVPCLRATYPFAGEEPAGFVAHFAQEVVQRPLPRSVEGMRRPERRPVRPPCGPRCPLRAPAAVSGAGAGVRGRRACTAPRPTLCTRAADAGAVVRLSGPAPPEGGARGRDGGRSPGRAPPARACWPLPGPPSRPWGAAPARRGGQAPAAATAGRPARPGPRCGARRWSDPVERRRAHAPGP